METNTKLIRYSYYFSKIAALGDLPSGLDFVINSSLEDWKDNIDIRTYKLDEFKIDCLDYCEVMSHVSKVLGVDLFEFLHRIPTFDKFKERYNISDDYTSLLFLTQTIKWEIIGENNLFNRLLIHNQDMFLKLPMNSALFADTVNNVLAEFGINADATEREVLIDVLFYSKDPLLFSVYLYDYVKLNHTYIADTLYSERIQYLEKKCKEVNFNPCNTSFPSSGDFEWTDETIEEADNYLRNARNNKNTIIMCVLYLVIFVVGLYLYNSNCLDDYMLYINIWYFVLLPLFTLYLFLRSIYLSEF